MKRENHISGFRSEKTSQDAQLGRMGQSGTHLLLPRIPQLSFVRKSRDWFARSHISTLGKRTPNLSPLGVGCAKGSSTQILLLLAGKFQLSRIELSDFKFLNSGSRNSTNAKPHGAR
jgi:hypothetical protein